MTEKVTGVGGERGKTKIVSTQDHPLEEKALYDANTELRSAVLYSKAREILTKLGLFWSS